MRRFLVLENGLVGALHLPEGKGPHPLVLAIGGFRSGFSDGRDERIASAGFASLALAYFGAPGLPPSLQDIPLEYFEKAIDWAAKHPLIDPGRIALWGVSRGAELSLLIGSFLPKKIRAIAATVPSSAAYGSIETDAPAWTFRGKPALLNAPFPRHLIDLTLGKTKESPLSLTPYFLEGMKDKAAFDAARIPVEKIECPLFLVSGEDDRMWPSAVFAEDILRRLKERGSSIPASHICYPGAGHAISSSDEMTELHPVAKIWFAFGGNPRDNALAKEDSWIQTVHFLRSWIF